MPARHCLFALLLPALAAGAPAATASAEAPPAATRVVVPSQALLGDPATNGLQARLRRAVEAVCSEAARTMVVGRQDYLADCRVRAMADAMKQAEVLGALVAQRR